MRRRDFLKVTGTFFVVAQLPALPGCGGGGPDSGTYEFPQGVASGDPRESSVVLWTRAVRAFGGTKPIDLRVEVATDAGFDQVVVSEKVQATADSDFTVRIVVSGLSPDTRYHYRFVAGADEIAGRTWTAPAASADVPVRFAWVSCQNYETGTYAAWAQLVADDEARDDADQVRFVLHLGDFIYESRGRAPLGDDFNPGAPLVNADGSTRSIPPFPSGMDDDHAITLEDYRHLYRIYAADPDLRAARARWPFVHTWDDHEFADDCWQSQTNFNKEGSTDEPAQESRFAATQAWSEYIPAHLTGAPGVDGVTQKAKDFAATSVTNAAFSTAGAANFVNEPNNAAAIGAITIYRSLRFGRHVELVVTDQRSYRSDHAVPEEFADAAIDYLHERYILPAVDVEIMDAGASYDGGNPPATVGVSSLPNPRIDSPTGTMLGVGQKAWWKATMKGSDATWKIWGNEVPFMRMFVKADPVTSLITDRLLDGDAWDGYPSERKELTTFLRDEGIQNVVILTGDLHAAFASTVHDDFKAASPQVVAVEFVAAGMTSTSLFSYLEGESRGLTVPAEVRGLVTYDASASGGSAFVENLNLLLLHGTAAAHTMHQTNDRDAALAASDPQNPHIKYADTHAQGFGVLRVTAAQVEATIVTIDRPVVSGAAPGVRRTASFVVPVGDPAAMTGPEFTGTPPFPFV